MSDADTAVTVRPIQPGDHVEYARLQHAVFGEPASHNDPAAALRRVLEVPSSVVVVAVVDERLVGSAIGGYDGCRGWLYAVAVDAGYRRRGVGGRLVRAVEQGLGLKGCPKINLQVRAENAAVAAFYESLGYAVEERVSMGKRLPG